MITPDLALQGFESKFSSALGQTRSAALDYVRGIRSHVRRALTSGQVFDFSLPSQLWKPLSEVWTGAQELQDAGLFRLPHTHMFLRTPNVVFDPDSFGVLTKEIALAVYQPNTPRVPSHPEGTIYIDVFTHRSSSGYGCLPYEFALWMEDGALRVDRFLFLFE